jgi:branched-chain amino acid transport system substrate-binding protein
MEGALYYYFGIPKNKVNEWLVANHYKRFKSAARLLHRRRHERGHRGGRGAQEDQRRHHTEKLIAAMEGMSFETPKGKMTFRKEDHQAMQEMYHFRIKNDPAFAWGVPELVREIPASELQIPIRNKR